jgi:hypothetical protein
MPYRTRRERRYRRKAKAAAAKPQSAGGWGQGSDIRPGDLLLIRKAIREGWDVPAATRYTIAVRMYELFEVADVRMSLAIVRTILAMAADNQATERSYASRHWGA